MQEKTFILAEALIYAVTLLAGGLGGAAMAGRRVLSHKPTTCAMIFAYTIIGAAGGGVTWAAMSVFDMNKGVDTVTVLGFCTVTGAAMATVLGGVQGTLSVILERLGWHIELKIDRAKPGGDMGKRRQDGTTEEESQ